MTLSGNILYGTAYGGGANNDGDVFSVPLSGGSPTVLASFNGGSVSDPLGNGCYPRAGLTLSGNTLFGATTEGGNFNSGTVFSIP